MLGSQLQQQQAQPPPPLLPSGLSGLLDGPAGAPGLRQHHLAPHQMGGMLPGLGGGGMAGSSSLLLPMVPTTGGGGGGLGGLGGQLPLPPAPVPPPAHKGGGGGGPAPGGPAKKSPYADLFSDMFEDGPGSAGGGGGGLGGLDTPGSGPFSLLEASGPGSGLLMPGGVGSSGLMGLRSSGGVGGLGGLPGPLPSTGLLPPLLQEGNSGPVGGGGGGQGALQHVPGSEVDLLANVVPPPAMHFF